MTWQKFQNTNQRFEDRISISPNNSFGFPKKFCEEKNLDTYKFMVIFYNPEDKAIGFQFTNSEEEKHKFRIVRSKGQYGINVTATSFFKSYNLDSKLYKGKYNAEEKQIDGIGSLFIINLEKNQNTNQEVTQEQSPVDPPTQQEATPPVA